MTSIAPELLPFLQNITLPAADSHKGQNGKLLIIGGSELFHAASRWSLDIASRFVDMVFYSSVPSNNELMKEAKGEFWNGIVIDRAQVPEYMAEADVVLIGPGMTRSAETAELTNSLVSKFPEKKWVIDAGALQMIDVKLLRPTHIITPHQGEWGSIRERLGETVTGQSDAAVAKQLGCVVVLKGEADEIMVGEQAYKIAGGNPGMTKGGTGDVLAGQIAGLYATNDALTAAVTGSLINKRAGESLAERVGPFFNSSDLVTTIPETLWKTLNEINPKVA
jgi:hydroxyethylthiazole kinase-like uncharacterized protein yjeF